eukprot:3699032-Rhodomonas_salina.3
MEGARERGRRKVTKGERTGRGQCSSCLAVRAQRRTWVGGQYPGGRGGVRESKRKSERERRDHNRCPGCVRHLCTICNTVGIQFAGTLKGHTWVMRMRGSGCFCHTAASTLGSFTTATTNPGAVNANVSNVITNHRGQPFHARIVTNVKRSLSRERASVSLTNTDTHKEGWGREAQVTAEGD